MIKTTKDLTKRLKLIFEVQEKTSSTLKIPLFSLQPKNHRFQNLQDVQRYMSKRYANAYTLDRTRQEGDETIYYFKSLPQENLTKREMGSSRAPLVQLRVRPRLLGH
ncbi:MAG TPA: hypothetical protein VJI32_02945 [Candidatus Nanoarchaeia archaeon]|nr:hypothetical protein [Candidatus Nanoarchaeia archaeon]